MNASRLFGNYQLTKYGYDYKKVSKFTPISDWYSGAIHYSETGYMNVIVRFAKDPQALDEVVAYSGTYKIDQDKIIHKVTASVRPEYEGQTLTRGFKIEGRQLITEFENTDEFIKYAVWTRI
jgi:Lipocalin-like domain